MHTLTMRSVAVARGPRPLAVLRPARAVRVPCAAAAKLTPYQGSRRTFGKYRCGNCSKTWQSAYSWANCSQQCKRCMESVYPYVQIPLKKSEDNKIDPNKPHMSDLCEKCQKLGYSCQDD